MPRKPHLLLKTSSFPPQDVESSVTPAAADIIQHCTSLSYISYGHCWSKWPFNDGNHTSTPQPQPRPPLFIHHHSSSCSSPFFFHKCKLLQQKLFFLVERSHFHARRGCHRSRRCSNHRDLIIQKNTRGAMLPIEVSVRTKFLNFHTDVTQTVQNATKNVPIDG